MDLPLSKVVPQEVIRIDRIIVKDDRIVCEICINPLAPKQTDAELAYKLTREYPTLAQHTCVNDGGVVFGDVIQNTSLPHLFEHMVIDLQVHASQSETASFVGNTRWVNKQQGRACIEVTFADDISALQAFREAADIINRAMIE